MKTGIEIITTERERQVTEEGWTPEHDDHHTDGSLARAAICYATPVKIYVQGRSARSIHFSDPWPKTWDHCWDKRPEPEHGNTIPDPDTYSDKKRIDLLAKAGALLAAEIDRINRQLDGIC